MQEPYEEYEKPVKDPRPLKEREEGLKRAQELTRRMNEASMKDSSGLIKWLQDSEQIPDDNEEPEDFIERTDNTLYNTNMSVIQKIQKAIKFAVKTHEVYQKQTRKGKDIPYIIHPLTVGLILSRFNANDDLVCAGILHDTIEDGIPGKKVTYEMLEERFNENVAQMVLDVSETNKDLPWIERKKEAIEHIKDFSHDSLMLKSADVISNVSEILDDYSKEGDSVFERFNAKKENTIQNYLNVMETILSCWPENPTKDELNSLISKLEEIKVNISKNQKKDKEAIIAVERTKINLFCILQSTRNERGGLSIEEVSGVIKDVLSPEEIKAIVKNLNEPK